MIYAALTEAADKGELLLVDNGMCRFHRRRDGTVVIREIIVLPKARRCGIGRRMIEAVQRKYGCAMLLAKCPRMDSAGNVGAANVFWRHLGFTLTHQAEKLNTWERLP